MTHYDFAYDADGLVFDPDREPQLFDGVLSKRLLAFVVDAIMVGILLILASVLILAMGVFTFGAAWLLFASPLFAIVALLYVGLTLGGSRSATLGMRVAGLTIRSTDGGRIGVVVAAAHSLLFWFSVSFLTPFVVIIGLFSRRRRLLQDLILDTVVMNAAPLARTRR